MENMKIKHIPEDILIQILARLPVKSVLRFRCVCKTWFNLLRSSDFIVKHYLISKSNPSFLLKLRRAPARETYLSVVSEKTLTVTETIPIPHIESEFRQPYLTGPCDGLFCLYGTREIALWNPATRELRAITQATSCCKIHTVGLGIDRKNNDYKVLSMGYDVDRRVFKVHIYSLKSESWRQIQGAPSMNHYVCPRNTHLNGVYYWWIMHGDGPWILSCDLADEVFRKVPLPDLGIYSYEKVELTIFNGSLAFVTYESLCFDVWVRTESGGKESWAKKLSIGPIVDDYSLLGFLKDGRIFFRKYSDGHVFLYELCTRQMKDLHLCGATVMTQVISYAESLVRISGRRDEEASVT